MFRFIFRIFIGYWEFGDSIISNWKRPIKCLTLNNQPCQTRPNPVNINSNGTLFYLFTVAVNKCGGSYKTINDPHAEVCVPKKVKNMNVKIFDLMSGVNETRFPVQYESCERK